MGVITLFTVGVPMFPRDAPNVPVPIAIEFIAIAQKTEQVAKEAEKEAPDDASKRQVYARAEATPDAALDAVPLPAPAKSKPVPKLKPKPKPEVIKRKRLRSQVQPRMKPKPPSRLKTSKLAALIDRSIKEEKDESLIDKEKLAEKKAEEKDKPRLGDLAGKLATASLIDAFADKVSTCWNVPSGAKGVDQMRVRISVLLHRDGQLAGVPKIMDTAHMDDGFFRVFAESTQRAVRLCAPYTDLPQDRYDEWRELEFNFDGARLLGQ